MFSRDEDSFEILSNIAFLLEPHCLVVIYSDLLVKNADDCFTTLSESKGMTSLYLIDDLIGNIIENNDLATVI